jgi:hypothetical protein
LPTSIGSGAAKAVSTEDAGLLSVTEQRRCHARFWFLHFTVLSKRQNDRENTELNLLAAHPPVHGEAMVVLDVSGRRSPGSVNVDDADLLDIGTKYESACLKINSLCETLNGPVVLTGLSTCAKFRPPTRKLTFPDYSTK